MSRRREKADKQSGVDRTVTGLRGPLQNFVNDPREHWPVSSIPGLNQNRNPWVEEWNAENFMNLYQEFPYYCDFPKPLLPPSQLPRSVFHEGDPGIDMITAKKSVLNEAERMGNYYRTKLGAYEAAKENNKLKNFEKMKDFENTNLPKYAADIADIIQMDPDHFFEGHYNYYFTGGSLDNIDFDGKNILLFPFSNEIVASPLVSKENSLWKLDLKKASKHELEGQVFELRHTIHSPSFRIFARLKNECVIYTMTHKKGKVRLYKVDSKTSPSPFISGDLDPFNASKACTLTVLGRLRIWDTLKGKSQTHGTYPTIKGDGAPDSWKSIRYQNDSNMLTLTDRFCVHYLDLRSDRNEPVLSMSLKESLEICDDVVSFEKPSQKEKRFYVGTYHSLFMLDSRSPKSPIQQKWTHQLESAPLLGNTFMMNGEEIITLSSQKPKDSMIIINTWQHFEEPHNFHLPYSPSHILDTLKEAQHLGKCLDPLLSQRLALSNSGSQIIADSKGNLFHLLQNSVGDVFYQGISHPQKFEKNSIVNCHAYYALEMWEKQMLTQRQGVVPLVLSDQANMEKLFNGFSRQDLKYKQRPLEESDEKPTWKQSVKKLSSYIDILAPEILAVWEVHDEKENLHQAPQHQKVLSWLEMSSNRSTDMESGTPEIDKDFMIEPVYSQELISVSQQREFEETDDYPVIIPDPIVDDDLSYFLPVKTQTTKKRTKKTNNIACFN